jgi:hypothetical protein
MRVLRAAMAGDADPVQDVAADADDQVNTDWATWPMMPTVVMAAAPKFNDLIAPASVQAAMRGPEWSIAHGWRAAAAKEVSRVEGFRGWTQISGSEMRRLRRDWPHQVSMGNIVAVLTIKRDPSGNPRAPEILRKLRVAISDPTAADSVDVESYSCCVDPMSNIVITALVPVLEAEQTSLDVGGAYWHGQPPAIADGGRVILAPAPLWLEGLGQGRYRARDKHGRRNFLRILGNMPGRRDAGRIWKKCLGEFLRAYGLRQLISDRRVWVRVSPLGTLVYYDHVDDSRLTVTNARVRLHFCRAWALQFDESLEKMALTEDFTGLRHRPTTDGMIASSGGWPT